MRRNNMSKLMGAGIAEIIKRAKESEKISKEVDFEENENLLPEEEEEQGPEISPIDVDFSRVDTEVVELEEIRDDYGRISDLIESLEECTGLSVIPLEMGHIAPEVTKLERHDIYEFDGERFAMSHHLRKKIIDGYKARIIKVLSSGLPFKESLNVSVEYDGKEYVTLQLSQDEWTYLMAIFRNYKERLYQTSDGQLYLEVLPDRV
jgi:Fe-S-cluster formation regulator IscX/YfhJ